MPTTQQTRARIDRAEFERIAGQFFIPNPDPIAPLRRAIHCHINDTATATYRAVADFARLSGRWQPTPSLAEITYRAWLTFQAPRQ